MSECTCHPVPFEDCTTYGSAIEPGSAFEPNPNCPEHFPKRVQTCKDCGGRGAAIPNWSVLLQLCPTCDGAGQVHLPRWKVACINWGHPDAPKAIAYRLGEQGAAECEQYFPKFEAAIAYADKAARRQG